MHVDAVSGRPFSSKVPDKSISVGETLMELLPDSMVILGAVIDTKEALPISVDETEYVRKFREADTAMEELESKRDALEDEIEVPEEEWMEMLLLAMIWI